MEEKNIIKVTKSAAKYHTASGRNLGLINFVVDIILRIDATAYQLWKGFKPKNPDNIKDPRFSEIDFKNFGEHYEYNLDPDYKISEISQTDLAIEDPGKHTIVLRAYKQELLQAFFSRLVDNFQIYLIEILREVLKSRPEILKSPEQTLSLEYVLGFNTINDLIQDVIEAKSSSMSYKGFSEIESWYSKKGISLITDNDQRDLIIEIIATRNIIAHNRGVVDTRYIQSVPATTLKVGDERLLDVQYLSKAQSTMNDIVTKTDQRTAQVFGLELFDATLFDGKIDNDAFSALESRKVH